LADLEPDSWRHIALRGRAHAEQDDWSLAAADFEACRGKDPEAIVEYNRALVRLMTNQDDHYRSAVRALFDAQEHTTNGVAANTTAWAACLIPKTGIDPERVVNLAQRAVDLLGTPEPLSTLGVAHYRAGQFAEAIKTLESSIAKQGQGGFIQDWAVLSLAYRALGQDTRAQQYMDRTTGWLSEQRDLRDRRATPDPQFTWQLRIEVPRLLASPVP
ncbi:MAG TPA: hypothetical protein VIY86_07215, partial [Pirellulaceae bacterium]